ncbi:3-oxoacyl-ACP synthase III family protein [Streptomyces sp. P1-3]|uniref:3-oxoacyl-ACP synthase III family protein n=1 Tax=Streptomyces sp. P1-3 TaxID=3421658 RepID=UPI003D36562E
MTDMRACVAGAAVHLAERWIDIAEREAQIAAASAPFVPPAGLVHRLTGVEGVHLVAPDQQASDLAVAAARKALAEDGASVRDIDLMIFAAGSQDMAEPATGHIVAAKLGLTCPAFDVKNACNSVLNGMEVAAALIAAGRYRTVLITCGEAPSLTARLRVSDNATFFRSFASYGFSDAGAAVLLRAGANTSPSAPGVLGSRFAADSAAWDSATFRFGGTVARDPAGERAYFEMDGSRLRKSIDGLGWGSLRPLLDELGLEWTDFAFVGVHQVAVADVERYPEDPGIPADRLILTLPRHGNVASASLPLQLVRAIETGKARPGDLIALVGLAAGTSTGLMVIRL